MRRLMEWIVSKLDPAKAGPRVFHDNDAGNTVYLSRWYLLGQRPDDEKLREDEPGYVPKKRGINLFIHRFHRSDADQLLHSHPWEWAVSLVLVGGYSEERRQGDDVIRRDVRPFSLNFLTGSDYHRVDLYEEDAWTLFLVGPKIKTWYFWDRHGLARVPWRSWVYRDRNRKGPGDGIEDWEPDFVSTESLYRN